MTIISDLRTYLLADSDISDDVGGERIYADRIKQPTHSPSIVIYTISGLRYPHASGDSALSRPRLQIDVWGGTKSDVDTLAGLVLARIQSYRGTLGSKTAQGIFLENERSSWDEPSQLYRYQQDFYVWFQDALS